MAVVLGSVTDPVEAAPDGTQRFALVIGYNGSPDGQVPDLRFADDDAIATHAMLVDAGVQAALFVEMDADTQRLHPDVIPDGPPHLDRILAHYDGLVRTMEAAARVGHTVEFSLYYSGHGDVEHGEGYVALRQGKFTRQVLYEGLLSRSPATHNHVFVDACKSYFLAFERGPGGKRTPFGGYLPPAGASVLANTGFVLSTSSARDSHEWEGFQGGIFSHELRSALRGGADVDGDGRITYNELGAFLAAANASIPNARLRPDALIRPPGGESEGWDATVMQWSDAHASLLLDGDVEHIYGESALGLRLFDVHPRGGEARRIFLPARLQVFLHDVRDTWERIFSAADTTDLQVRFSALAAEPSALAPRGAAHLAMRELFALPFGAPEVAAYTEQRDVVTSSEPEAAAVPRLGLAPWVAGGAALVGLGLDIWAWERYGAANHASQARRVTLDNQVQGLHAAALGCYAVTAVAAGYALFQWLWPREAETDVRVGAAVDPLGSSAQVQLEGAW